MTSERIEARVERERDASESRDVIAAASRLKGFFSHVQDSQSYQRLRRDEWKMLALKPGMRVLDFGCGKGDYSIEILKAGAKVFGIDISPTYIAHCEAAAKHLGFPSEQFEFQVMDAHSLKFEDNVFDVVVGNGILHHLDLRTALKEINRVLKPQGRAVFTEPLGGNPLLKFFRLLTPWARTADEAPLLEADLAELELNWQVENMYYGATAAPAAVFTSLVLRPWPDNFFVRVADAIDQRAQWRWFRSWHQYVLLNLVKP